MTSETLMDGSTGVEVLYICKILYGDHKAKVCDRRTNNKEKRRKAFPCGRSPFTEEHSQRGSGEQGATGEPAKS